MNRIKEMTTIVVMAFVFLSVTAAPALALTVYSYGANLITSTEQAQLHYRGDIKAVSSQHSPASTATFTYYGWERYAGGSSGAYGETTHACSPNSGTFTKTIGAWDSLNPAAPKATVSGSIVYLSRTSVPCA